MSCAANSPKHLGLFSSALEAAMIRDQILDREGKLTRKNKKGTEDKTSKNLENFSHKHWGLLADIGALIDKFLKK